jgi:hypothetical protein
MHKVFSQLPQGRVGGPRLSGGVGKGPAALKCGARDAWLECWTKLGRDEGRDGVQRQGRPGLSGV